MNPLQRQMHIVFIDAAYDQLNWGKPVGLSGNDADKCHAANQADCPPPTPPACVTAKEHILRIQDPDPEWAARHMERADANGACAGLANFNRKATPERTIAADLNLIGGVVLLVLFGLIGLTLLIAKFTLTLIFAAAPFAAVAAVFPGAARRARGCGWGASCRCTSW